MSDVETLLGSSSVYLFGKRLGDLILKPELYKRRPDGTYADNMTGANNFLRNQLAVDDAGLARIFAYAFEGVLFQLDRPAIFLVHGAGFDPDDPPPKDADGFNVYRRLARSPGSSSSTGLGLQDSSFAYGTSVWVYDKNDASLRMDVETGTLDQILLAIEAGYDIRGSASGVMGRSSGGRSSGAMGRSSGWTSRRSRDTE